MNPTMAQLATTSATVFPDPLLQPQFQKQYMQQQRLRQQQLLPTFNPNGMPVVASNAPLQLHDQAQAQLDPASPPLLPPQLQQQQNQAQHPQTFHDKQQVHGRQANARPGLSLDTSDERLQGIKVFHHNNRRYLKLFSPSLVESPISYLDRKQQSDDRRLWENGPNDAFQKQLEMERREAHRARSKQQLRGFFMGLWLGSLLGVLMLHHTTARVQFWRHDTLSAYLPLVILMIIATSIAIVRSGTRSTLAAVAACAAVLTCVATLIVNQSRYSTELRLFRRGPNTTSTDAMETYS